MLLLRNISDIKLEKPIQKILKVCPAFNDTFVMITCQDMFDEEKLVHIDSRGKVLWEKPYKESVDTFGFFRENEVIVVNINKAQIEIIDLSSYETRTHPHYFSFGDTTGLEIQTFYDTRLLCIQESGLIGQGKLILNYYSYSSHSFDKVSEYKSQEGEWTYGQQISKVNNHSKIVWWEPNQSEEFIFKFWSLKKNPKGELEVVKVRNTVSNIHGLASSATCVGQIWENDDDVYNLVCQSSINAPGLFKENYIIDIASGVVRPAKFRLPELQNDVSCLHFFNFGTFSVYHTQNTYNHQSNNSKVYYIDNKSQKIVYEHLWKATSKSHFFIPGYDPNALVEATHENSDVSEIQVINKRLMTIPELYLHLMLGVNEDFDDDLLQDTIEILGYINL